MRTMWVGFIFFVAILILGAATLIIGNLWQLVGGEATYVILAVDDAQGLKPGDDVRVDGIEFGKVQAVELDDRAVGILMRLYKKPVLYSNYEVTVESRALLGGAIVSIRRGDPSRPKIKWEDLPKEKIDDTEYPLLIGRAAPDLLKGAGKLIEENRENIQNLISDLRDVARELKEAKVSEKVNATLSEAKNTFEKVNRAIDGDGTLARLMKTDELHRELVKTVQDVQQVVKDLREGQGLAPALLHDKKMKEDAETILTQVKSAAENLNSISDQIKKSWLLQELQSEETHKKVTSTIEGADKTLGRIGRSKAYLNLGYTSFADTDMSVGRAYVTFWPTEDKYFLFGAAGISIPDDSEEILTDEQAEGDDLSKIKGEVQLAYRIPWVLNKHLWIRGGMIEGKLGGALDLDREEWGLFRHPIRITFEARDAYNDVDDEDIDERLDGPVFRAYAKTPIFPRGVGWFGDLVSNFKLTAGGNRLFEDGEFFVGLTLEYEEEDIRTLVGLVGTSR